jgi:hypothetical protein
VELQINNITTQNFRVEKKWWEHVEIMEDYHFPKGIFNCGPLGRRTTGRPKREELTEGNFN